MLPFKIQIFVYILELSLASNCVNEKVLESIAKYYPRLKRLSLSVSLTRHNSYRYIDKIHTYGLTSISRMNNLESLTLNRFIRTTKDEFISIFSNGNLKNLLKLDLYFCIQINDEVLKTISENCPKLEILKIYDLENVGDQGIQSVIKHCKNLKELYLNGYRLRHLSNRCLFGISNLPHFRLLNLDGSNLLHAPRNITDSFLEQLKFKYGYLKIINCEGNRVYQKNWKRTSLIRMGPLI